MTNICATGQYAFRNIRRIHLDTCDELGIELAVRTEVERLLNELQQLLIGISIMQVGFSVLGRERVHW